jgi:thiamine-phosphate pyrophosphorylase
MRIIDANANRAREALRVLEDYARFVLNDESLSQALKELRHGLAAALQEVIADAMVHRDTPGDVGTTNKTPAELQREGLAHIVTAAGKRLGEALRSLEEFAKIDHPEVAGRIEALRYRFYALEQQIAAALCPAKRFAEVRLYVLVTEAICKRPWLEAAEQAIDGGADCLQLREKDLPAGELLCRAKGIVALCRRRGALSIINDRPDIAVLSGADGVHVGQEDVPAAEARRIVGRDKIVGVSTHRIEQARQAVLDGADYIGAGPIYRSSTKPRDFVAGLEYARQVANEISLPAVAIAGITAANVDEVLGSGLRAVAVTAAVIGCDDIAGAARRLREKLVLVRQTFVSASLASDVVSPVPVGQTFLSASSSAASVVGQTFLSASSSAASVVGQTFLSASSRREDFEPPEIKQRRRRLPHWEMAGATYFLTFRVAEGELSESERDIVMQHLLDGSKKFYDLAAAVVMPDHVHVLLAPRTNVALSRVSKRIKGTTARKINIVRKDVGSVWQEESWNRIVRDQAELEEKIQYMLNNPVKRELVDDPWKYKWWFCRQEQEEADKNVRPTKD